MKADPGWTPFKLVAPRQSLMGNPGDFFIRHRKVNSFAVIVQVLLFNRNI